MNGSFECPNCETLYSDLSSARQRNKDVLARIADQKAYILELEAKQTTQKQQLKELLQLKKDTTKDKARIELLEKQLDKEKHRSRLFAEEVERSHVIINSAALVHSVFKDQLKELKEELDVLKGRPERTPNK